MKNNISEIALLGSSDAGPLKYLLFLRDIIDLDTKWIASNTSEFLLEEKSIVNEKNWHKLKNVKIVITGTCQGKGIDKDLILWAKENKIPSISIIEHWSWYKKRFEYDSDYLFPDFIFVNDVNAKNQAIDQGIPRELIHVAGNIVLEDIGLNQPKNKSHKQISSQHQLPEKDIIFFISESLKNSFPKNSNDYLGYDEYVVLDHLIESTSSETKIVIKLHPEEPLSKYDQYLSNRISIIRNIPIEDIAIIAKRIVGMGSMLLLELAMYRDDIISYKPNNKKDFIGDEIGATINIDRKSILKKRIANLNKGLNHIYRDRFIGSKETIKKLIMELL